jgi:hypothetical protein
MFKGFLWMLLRVAIKLLIIIWATNAWAQNCGPTNPSCLVPLPPQSDNSNRAAPTKWVKTFAPTIPLGGDVTGTTSSNTVSKIQGTTVTGTTGSGAVMLNTSPTFSGTLTGGNGAFAALSASGAVTGAGMNAFMTAGLVSGQPGAFSTLSTSSQATVATLNIAASGMVGDGTTSNNTAFQAALTAAQTNGGEIKLPCGVFKNTGAFTLSIAAGKHVSLKGSGLDCTELYFSGTSTGLTVTLGSNTSTFQLNDLAYTTDDTTNANTGIAFNSTATTVTGAQNIFTNVVFRGHSGYLGSDYWNTAVAVNDIDDITFNQVMFVGGAGRAGNGISTTSVSSTKFTAVVNVANSIFVGLNQSIIYGNYVQAIYIANGSFIDDNYCVYVPASETGVVALNIVNTSCEAFIVGVYEGTNVPNTQISNNYFIIHPTAYGMEWPAGSAANQTTITGNIFGGLDTTDDIGIVFNTAGGTNAIINGNVFEGLQYAIAINAAQGLVITNNLFTNLGNAQVAPFSSVVAYGNTPGVPYALANLPTCNSSIWGIPAVPITNGVASPTYHQAVGSTTGSTWQPVWCAPTASAWVYD